MILLKNIQLVNFLSHEKTTIEFGESEKCLIDGASGAGKSSIFDAIIWCLYGNGRVDNKNLIRKGYKEANVIVSVIRKDTKGDENFTISRKISNAGKHTLSISSDKSGLNVAIPTSGVRETQQFIDSELIGASYLLFINSVAYVQGNAESFVSQSAPKRKELLLEIVKAEDYKKYYEKARTALSSLEKEHSNVLGQIEALKGVLSSMGDNEKHRKPNMDIILGNSSKITTLNKEMAILKEKSIKLYDSMQSIVFISENLKTATENKNFIENMLHERKIDISTKPKLIMALEKYGDYEKRVETAKDELENLRNSLTTASEIEAKRNDILNRKPFQKDFEAELDRLKIRMKTIEANPVCPSGEKCPYSGDHSKQIKNIGEDIIVLLKEETDANTKMDEWKVELDNMPEKKDLSQIIIQIKDKETSVKSLESGMLQIESIKKDIENIEGIEKKIPEIEATLAEKVKYVEELTKKKEEAEKESRHEELIETDKKIKEIDEKCKELSSEVSKATAIIEMIDINKKELNESKNKISFLEIDLALLSGKIRKVACAKNAFSPKGGIETMVIDYLLPKLEDRINEVLSKLSEFRVRLDTQKNTSDGEGIIEGLFITILNDRGVEMPYEAYSGGERLKISVAISEALATLQKVGFRLFDEVFIGLDENSTESFAEILDELQKSFSQVLCISHLIQIKELFDKKITVIKNNNQSYVNRQKTA
ncbi:MAG: SMC family ATPase [Bacilli bacterium]|jgi:exonuclease SbcC